MTVYPFPENRLTKAAFGLFLFAMLYLTRDSMVTTALLGFYKAQFLMIGLIAMAMMVFLWTHRRRLKEILLDKRMAGILICAVILLVPMVVKQDWQLMYFSILICLLFAVFLSYFLTTREVAKYYVGILTVLGAYSVLTTYFLRRLPDGGILPVPVFYTSNEVELYNFLLSFVSVSFVKNRNFGIFREPGVYQFFLILGLYLNHYVVSWKKSSHCWIVSLVLSVVMFTTFATGGIIELALFWVVLFFDKKLYRNKWVWAVVLILGIAGTVVFRKNAAENSALYWELYDMFIGKFTYQLESITDRLGSLLVNLKAFLAHPIFGSPIGEVLHAIDNNTSSTLILFAIFGFVGGCLHVAGWMALVWRKEQHLLVNLMLLLILFMGFNTQNLTADVFFWLFPMMALTERGLPLLKLKKGEK